ncbi:GL8D1-like protein [Mya arenaria]|uniref:GL8D1-like protein n=1 Tax=Mya arenaria TaxID=6604 RepID=A0ABY7EZI4_MYAAR|nr:GL8D1-like protein [Mya arenaria]
MAFTSTKKALLAVGLVWLGVMFCLWFRDTVHLDRLLELTQRSQNNDSPPQSGKFEAKAFQMARFNKTKLEQDDVVHVCITSDENTLGGMVALINSIDQNTHHPIMFHLVVDQNSLTHIKTWLEGSRLHDIMYEVIAFQEEWVRGKVKMNYARYYFPQLFPDLHGRIVFIDDDSIVQGDVYDLFKMTIKPDHWATFAEDCTGSAKRITMMQNHYADYIDFKNKHVQELGISPTECAFNTGVYVTDLDLWRKHNITEKLEKWLVLNTQEEVYGNEKGGGGSQPPMMLVFYKKYTPLDPSWNVRNLGIGRGNMFTKSFLQQAKLLHWSGRVKPWDRSAQHSYFWDKYFIKDRTEKFVPIRKS